MQRDHILKIFLKGFAFALFGNILSGIMIISIAPMISIWFVCFVAFILTVFIYASLLFTAGWKDGTKENSMLKNHRVESVPKYRWIALGLIIGIIISVPSIIILFGKLGLINISGEYMFAHYFLNGTVRPLIILSGMKDAAPVDYPLWLPIASALFYIIISPIAAHIGYKFGVDDKVKENIMFEK